MTFTTKEIKVKTKKLSKGELFLISKKIKSLIRDGKGSTDILNRGKGSIMTLMSLLEKEFGKTLKLYWTLEGSKNNIVIYAERKENNG